MLGLRRHVFPHTTTKKSGAFAIDVYGGTYYYDDLKERIENGTIIASNIVAIGIDNLYLRKTDRGDGTKGCGFCIGMNPDGYDRWADSRVCFYNIPEVKTINAVKLNNVIGGKLNSELIYNEAITRGINTPAINYCLSQTLSIGGVERNGFLPSIVQMYYLAQYLTTVKAFYTLLGKTPSFYKFGMAGCWCSNYYNGDETCEFWYSPYYVHRDVVINRNDFVVCFDL